MSKKQIRITRYQWPAVIVSDSSANEVLMSIGTGAITMRPIEAERLAKSLVMYAIQCRKRIQRKRP